MTHEIVSFELTATLENIVHVDPLTAQFVEWELEMGSVTILDEQVTKHLIEILCASQQ